MHKRLWEVKKEQASPDGAYFGTGDRGKAAGLKETAVAEAPEGWMAGTLNEQLGKLEKYLDAQASPNV